MKIDIFGLIKSWLDTLSPILVAFITAVLTYALFVLKNKINNNKNISIEQYKKVFAPIHKILKFENPKVDKFMYYDIKQIISSNYDLLPANTLSSFNNIQEDNFTENDKKFLEFKEEIEACFRFFSSSLGYSREKLSIHDRIKAKKIINSSSFDYIYSKNVIFITIFSIIISFLIILIGDKYTDTITIITATVGFTPVVFMFCMIIYLLKTIIPYLCSFLANIVKKAFIKLKKHLKNRIKCNKGISAKSIFCKFGNKKKFIKSRKK